MSENWRPVVEIPTNTRGADYVIGDVHGCFDLVLRAMDAVKFDQSRDRIISVGDLIDRGPGSHRTAKFLSHDWVYACRGNHEGMLQDLYNDGEPLPAVLEFMASHNGFGWWLETSDEVRQDILEAVRTLPIAMQTVTRRGLAGFVHADVPQGMDWETFKSQLRRGDEKTIEVALWGRDRLHDNDASGVVGLGRLFVGHTPLRRLSLLGNVYAIDTGAVYGVLDVERAGALTFFDILTGTNTLKTLQPMSRISVAEFDGATHPFTALTA